MTPEEELQKKQEDIEKAMTPEEELQKKQKDLERAKAEIDRLNQAIVKNNQEIANQNGNINSLQADIKALQAMIADIKQASEDYAKWYAQKNDQLIKARVSSQRMVETAKAVIENEIEKWIDWKIKESKDDLATKKAEVEKAKTASETARDASKKADDEAQRKQAVYDALKKIAKGIDTDLQELTGLLDQANKAEGQGDYMVLYFWGREADAVATKIQIQSPEEHAKSLRKAQDAVEKAKSNAAGKKGEADEASKKFGEANKQYEAMIASRRGELLKEIKDKFKPKAG